MEKIESFFTLIVNTYINIMTEQFLTLRDWIPLEKLSWYCLSSNQAAIHLLEQNPDKIDWYTLSLNPAIFTYDYDKMREYMESTGIKDELIAYYYRPENIHKFIERGDLLDDFNSRWS